jgi:hypothetical protein
MRTSAADPIRLEPEAFYDDPALRVLLGLPTATLARARRDGELRYVRRGRRTYYRGDWVLEWLAPPADPSRDRGEARR